ncbi:hypothetical protein BP5796_11940 [Coleophoma crateriformis]|uniref:Uncharacterized protein n=1 Tax=Coleophoma crateriformis TaxID=565419 RepID=A0A3D8QB04_9HELO|nr:hypothetical protein BP5796_11940 [Coleophoma crateriformis]
MSAYVSNPNSIREFIKAAFPDVVVSKMRITNAAPGDDYLCTLAGGKGEKDRDSAEA